MQRIVVVLVLLFSISSVAQTPRWSEEKAAEWYKQQPWLVGSNFIPADAINELEMWQSDTFNPQEIDRELGWAEGLGMNTMRVFLHDLLWQQDAGGFAKRLDQFLSICAKHHIRPMLVIFDSVWDPNPKLGPQHPPVPGVHNSGWMQSPGRKALEDPAEYPRLKTYVQGVVGKFANDPRILACDVWNEPDNDNKPAYEKVELPNKADYINKLLPQVFEWAREMHPVQPLTSGVWRGDYSSLDKAIPTAKIQLEQSDVITFHSYDWPETFEERVKWLRAYNRPIICTEYMARPAGSTFDTVLPAALKEHVGAINWGLVVGKTQTNLPWDSWKRPYVLEPPVSWFHEVFYPDGRPYRAREAEIIRSLTSQANGKAAPAGAN